ncbi:hypothetical protein TIFTF001_039814 [Ficus carica]|uniref:Transposase (putative) gypsy type domain-containing protein n=1 Tax=Ficus carica TaxID=3494 RepID=A0AA87YV54_FICCA|nr:hypothetical protein TIFTF001_039801 [Ficus carica]GMN19431.1 hypothetical protein TIFTF001_039804 [Ficus carica]GMN19452.1 hypothetical protein TIFTF001_039811 [Ficus carica]GMN19460.1 hypothetical protein TIFTF001_039814 [Ficus carica]
MSGDPDITGSSSTILSSSLDTAEGAAEQGARTPDHLLGISDVPSPDRPPTPTSWVREGVARLEQILRIDPGTRPDQGFIDEINGAGLAQPAPVVDLTAGGDDAYERTASQASTTGREGSESSRSMPPAEEPVQTHQRNRGRSLRVNGLPVYRMVDREMVDQADDRPVYLVDYFTTAVTLSYLAALREEFEIPNDVELIVPGPNDFPSRPPPGCITLSTEFFRAGLRLPFHPFLRRMLTRLNVSPMQLNANTYRILISCYILWAKNFVTELPFSAFQNLYRMKSAPAYSGSYYFQGYQGTFM